ncbi:hypothetical protein D3C81_1604460 [compost metagenome]
MSTKTVFRIVRFTDVSDLIGIRAAEMVDVNSHFAITPMIGVSQNRKSPPHRPLGDGAREQPRMWRTSVYRIPLRCLALTRPS